MMNFYSLTWKLQSKSNWQPSEMFGCGNNAYPTKEGEEGEGEGEGEGYSIGKKVILHRRK